jgi:hypothetical protein
MSDRMFHVLVLGGMALVGCGGSTSAEPGQGTGDAAASGVDDSALADVATPLDASVGLLDASGSLDGNPGLGTPDAGADWSVPREGPPPPPPPVQDAQSQDAASDADGYADAAIGQKETGVPSEAPPQ